MFVDDADLAADIKTENQAKENMQEMLSVCDKLHSTAGREIESENLSIVDGNRIGNKARKSQNKF